MHPAIGSRACSSTRSIHWLSTWVSLALRTYPIYLYIRLVCPVEGEAEHTVFYVHSMTGAYSTLSDKITSSFRVQVDDDVEAE